MRRISLAAMAALVVAATGCGVTTTSVRCENANCEAKLKGGGADTEIDALALRLTLEDTDGDRAELKLERRGTAPDKTIELTQGQSIVALETRVTLLKVDGSEVIVRLAPAAASG